MKIVDLHCDTISYLCSHPGSLANSQAQFDLVRARAADLVIQFMALFTMPGDSDSSLRQILKQTERFLAELEANSQTMYHVKHSGDLCSAENSEKIGCILHVEGGECLGTDMEILRILYHSGLRSMSLTWNHRNLLADGVGEGKSAGGLSRLGKEVVKEMSRLGMMLDLTHISPPSYYEALDFYPGPVLVSHANARALCPHWRNLDDGQLRILADHGGLIGITQVADFIKEGHAGIDDMLDHIVYIADLVGVEHVALGSDFDGADNMVIGNVSGYSQLPALLAKRGFTVPEIEMILSENALRVIKQVI